MSPMESTKACGMLLNSSFSKLCGDVKVEIEFSLSGDALFEIPSCKCVKADHAAPLRIEGEL